VELYEAIRARRSVRSFREDPVNAGRLERILEAARLAPSARNAQEWRFVIVSDAGMRSRLALEAAGQAFIGEAPLIVVCCAETDGRVMRCGQPAYTMDVAIAVDHLTLAAAAEGLGTCWIGSFDEGAVKGLLGIPPAIRVVTLTPLGFPRDRGLPAGEKPRRELPAIVRRERW
jgi:nitroreductase